MLTTTAPQIEYTMDGATLTFDFPFAMWRALVANELTVIFQEGETDEATLSINTDYSLSAPNNDYASGGTVTLVSGSAYITNGKTLLLRSDVARSQIYDIEHGGGLNEAALEQVLDRMTRMVQEAELYSSISQTALDSSIKANFANVVCWENSVVCIDNEIVTI